MVKRPKKRLLKADAAKRAAFVDEYATLRADAVATGATHFFVDEAHCYADVDLRGKWMLKGTPALVDSSSPRYGEQASYSSAVCVETGAVEVMALEGNSTAETSTSCLKQLRAHHAEPLVVFWDNAPAHGGDSLRAYLATPDLRVRLVRLPAYSPDFNANEGRPTKHRDSPPSQQCARAYHRCAPWPSARWPHPAGDASVSRAGRAAVGDRVAGWEPAICSRLLVYATRAVSEGLTRGRHGSRRRGSC